MSNPIEKPLTIFVRPLPGMRVKDPDTLALLAPEGEEKPAESYWFRRIADKEVEMLDRPKFDKATSTGEAAQADTDEKQVNKRAAVKADEKKGS